MTDEKEPKRRFPLDLSREERKILKIAAAVEDTSMNEFIRTAIRERIERLGLEFNIKNAA